MLKQYEIIIENEERKLFPIANVDTEDIDSNTNNIFEMMTVLNNQLKFGYMETEHIYIVSCDYKGGMIGLYLAGIGENNKVTIDRRKIALFLLLSGANKYIMIHNHSKNILTPSIEDKDCSETMKSLGEIIGIDFIGNYIITEKGYCNIDTGKKVIFNEME